MVSMGIGSGDGVWLDHLLVFMLDIVYIEGFSGIYLNLGFNRIGNWWFCWIWFIDGGPRGGGGGTDIECIVLFWSLKIKRISSLCYW